MCSIHFVIFLSLQGSSSDSSFSDENSVRNFNATGLDLTNDERFEFFTAFKIQVVIFTVKMEAASPSETLISFLGVI
jgi:hypothetical protein